MSGLTIDLELPDKLVPVFEGEADVRGSHGGRGSAKTRTFAMMTAVRAHMWDRQGRDGIILCGRQFMNSLADSSLEEVKAAIRSQPWLEPHFDIGENYIRTRSGRISYSFAGLQRNIDSIKSKSRILLAWIEEAEGVAEEAWAKLLPTLREEDSELWLTWNPENEDSPTNKRFRDNPDPRMKIVEMNWRDNPWFPDILNRLRMKDLAERPHSYQHVWEGAYLTAFEGAYFAADLAKAREERRIGFVAPDPLMQYKAFWDIGTTDACAIWVAQFIGSEVRVLDYYEASGQPLASHLNWLRSNGYGSAQCVLPHDGANVNHITAIRFDEHIKAAGFETKVIANQGKGAAIKRIEMARRLFPSVRFNEATCTIGLKRLAWYHEKKSAQGVGLGPDHDESSHGADAFGLMCVAHGELVTSGTWGAPIRNHTRVV